MTKKGILGLLGLTAWALTTAGAQTVSLDQAVEAALAHGAEAQVWAAGLASSRAAEATARARAGLTVSTNLQYSASQTTSDPEKATDTTIPQSAVAGLTVGIPLTSVTAKGTRRLATDPAGTTVVSDEGSLTVNQVLWNGYWGGPAQAAAEKAALALKTAELNAAASRNRLILSVKQAYFTLLSTQEALVQLRLASQQRQETARFAQTKFDLGQATGLDLKQAQINARSASLDLDAGTSAWEAARRRLANLMGRPDATLAAGTEADPQLPPTLGEAVSLALRQRVELQVAQANARSAQIDADLAFGSSTPSFNLTGGVTLSRDPVKNTGAVVGTLGVNVGVPLLDGGLAGAQGTQASSQKTSAQVQFQQLSQSIPVDVTEAWNTWNVAVGRVEVASLAVEVAEGQRMVTKAQFDAGLKTLSDLQSADIALSTAQQNALKAKITAQLSALTLLSLMGQ